MGHCVTAEYDDVLQQKLEKYRQQFPGKENKRGVEMLARSSVDRHFRESGDADFRRNAPLRNAPAGHDSIDSDAPQRQPAIAQAQPQLGAPVGGGTSDADYLNQVFGKAGGLRDGFRADDDADDAPDAVQPEEQAAGPKKQGWGSRLWNGLKGFGGILKNVTGYNLIRHGLFGANFRRGKVNKNAEKKQRLAQQIREAQPGSADMKRLQSEFNVVDHKLFTNRAKLGQHRQYYSGRKMANEFTSLFRGRNMGMAEGRKPFFTGGIVEEQENEVPVRAMSERAMVAPPEPPVQAPPKPQVQAPVKDDTWNVAQAQQQYGGGDDLQYDEYGNPIFD